MSADRRGDLARAFPSALRQDALTAISVLSGSCISPGFSHCFSLRLQGGPIFIPYRIYYYAPNPQNNRLTPLQSEMLDCLFTRHHDGFVRQARLTRIIRCKATWTPCFVVPLIGEYVVEILRIIYENLDHLEGALYSRFVRENPEFLALTEQRVISYWNCYYRWSIKRTEYPGFLILDYLKSIAKDA